MFSEDSLSQTASTQTKQDQLINLLNLFSTFRFFRYYKTEGNWVLPITSNMTREETKTITSSEFFFSDYYNKSIGNLDINKLSDVSIKYRPLQMVDYSEYYQNNPNYDYDTTKEIIFPSNTEHGLKAYFQLNADELPIINSAIKSSVLCMELADDKTTLGILSGFTSIETIMNFYYKNFKPEVCSECGQQRYKISKRYSDFLLTFIGNGEGFKKKFSKLYSLRSKIVHTGFSFQSEQFWNELNESEKENETITILEIIMLSKVSIILKFRT